MDNIKQEAQNQISNSILKLHSIKATMVGVTVNTILDYKRNIHTKADYNSLKKIIKFLGNKDIDELWSQYRTQVYNHVYYNSTKTTKNSKEAQAGDK